MCSGDTPRLARITVHPRKSLDPVYPEHTTVVENGGLEHDREYAMVDDDDVYVNGKRTDAVHRLRASYDEDINYVSLRRQEKPEAAAGTFHLEGDRRALDEWINKYLGIRLI